MSNRTWWLLVLLLIAGILFNIAGAMFSTFVTGTSAMSYWIGVAYLFGILSMYLACRSKLVE